MAKLQVQPAVPPSPCPPAAPRLHFIDGLRGLAMLMVLLYHCWLFGGQWQINLPLGTHHVDIAAGLGFGHIGVNLFLVLSGFCLFWPFTRSERREPTLWGFAKKRCRRILPPYYVTLLLFAGLPWLQSLHHHLPFDSHFTLTWLILHLTMLHNLRPDYVISINGSLWSLALEFQLYVLFPLLVEAFRRFPARAVLLAVFLVCTAYRYYVAQGHYAIDDAYGYVLAYSIFGRCFEFALGMYAAIMVARWHSSGTCPLKPVDAVALLMLPASLWGGFGGGGVGDGSFAPLTDAFYGLMFAGLLVAASRQRFWLYRVLSAAWLVRLGIFSYSVYLIHLPLVMALAAAAQRRHLSNTAEVVFQLLLVVPLMLGLGYLFHLMFERPFMGPSRSTSTPDATLPTPPLTVVISSAESKPAGTKTTDQPRLLPK